MSQILGIGIDLTQHIPVVSVCLRPPHLAHETDLTPELLSKFWPPVTELRGSFAPQPPVVLLPIARGEPLMTSDAAAHHRRSAGLAWPPESQIPFGDDPRLGNGRIPLVATWFAILPQNKSDSAMTSRVDHEFSWMPDDDKPLFARAGEILALSIKSFLEAAKLPYSECLTAIVVPDSLDEAGQQILLDSLGHCGFDLEKIHLLPRPLAAALSWCQSNDGSRFGNFQTVTNEEGTAAGRLRLLTMSLDFWEAQSFEIRARFEHGRTWLVPVRDRSRVSEAPPELPVPGIATAIVLALANSANGHFEWWTRLFASDWLFQRLALPQPMNQTEFQAWTDLTSRGMPLALRRQTDSLKSLSPIWHRCFAVNSNPLPSLESLWQKQEKLLGISFQNTLATLATGTFSNLRDSDGRLVGQTMGGQNLLSQSTGCDAPARGASLAAAAIAHKLPCYRETLLPLELFVSRRDELGDLRTDWIELVPKEKSVEAGKTWKSEAAVTGLQIKEGNKELWLPLKRSIHQTEQYREVASELMEPTKKDEPVSLDVAVKPGQGYARVNILSVKAGFFSTRLDWRTMKECKKPEPPRLTYLPGVSRIEPYKSFFKDAAPLMRDVVNDFDKGSSHATIRLGDLIKQLNKWPRASVVDRRAGQLVTDDFMKHYSVFGSDGLIQNLSEPGLARAFQSALGDAFDQQMSRKKNPHWDDDVILRAAGWMYLAMPDTCYEHLRQRMREAAKSFKQLGAVELHAVGLAFQTSDDLEQFYPLVLEALNRQTPPNNWLRAIRNICRFRNHALHPDVISDKTLTGLVEFLLWMIKSETDAGNFASKFNNCLESFPFLLKRRRYAPDFLAPETKMARNLIALLKHLDDNSHRLARRMQSVPNSTLNFICKQATASDIDNLLGIDEE